MCTGCGVQPCVAVDVVRRAGLRTGTWSNIHMMNYAPLRMDTPSEARYPSIMGKDASVASSDFEPMERARLLAAVGIVQSQLRRYNRIGVIKGWPELSLSDAVRLFEAARVDK
jgi:hypothetical protein